MNPDRRTSETNLKRSSTENVLSEELPLAKIKKNDHSTNKKESSLQFTCTGSTTSAANKYEIFHDKAESKSVSDLKKLFYNAVRSNSENEFDKLFHDIQKNNKSVQEIAEGIANAYEELLFINVPLSDEMKQLVQKYLINLRFDYNESYLDTNREYSKTTDVADEVKKRIEMIAEITELHFTEYFDKNNDKEVDKKFLYLCRTIARELHILKKQLRITYDKLPWEEMEFYLVCFVSSYTKCEEINWFYRAVLSKQNLWFYLKNFVDILKELKKRIEKKDINNKFDTLKLNKEESQRNQVKKKIIDNNKNFTSLYEDFKEIKNVYSLNQINYYIELALHKTHDKKLESLARDRALQIMGEYLKYTLESPNLSEDISKLIISKFNWDIKRIIIKLRDNLSHMYLSKDCLILKKKNARQYPIDFENDLIKIKTTISNVLHKMKIGMMQKVKKKFTQNEIKDVENLKRLFHNLDLTNAVLTLSIPEEFDEIKGLIESYKMQIENLTEDEQKKFNEIDEMLQHEKEITKFNRSYESFISEFRELTSYGCRENLNALRSEGLLLLYDQPPKRNFCNEITKDILTLVFEIYESIEIRMDETNYSKCHQYLDEICAICEHKIGHIENIKKFKDKFERKFKENEVQDKINEFLTALYKKLGDPVRDIFESFKELESISKSRPLGSKPYGQYDVDKFQFFLENSNIKKNTENHKNLVNYFKNSQWRKLGKELTAIIKPYKEFVNIVKNFCTDSKFENVKGSIEKLCSNLDPSVHQNLKTVLNEISMEEEIKLEEHFKNTLDLLEYALDAKTKEKYKNNFDKLDPIYETLLLDIFAYFEEKLECLNSNEYGSQFFLDKCIPTPLGKSLRNHLAHGTPLANILPADIKGVILSNVSRIMKRHKGLIESKSHFVIDQPPLKIEYLKKCLEDNLQTIQNQQNMFTAIERDDIKAIQHFLNLGADKNGRNIYNWNVLHYASKNDSFDTFNFFLNYNLINAENMEGLKPLHISAQKGGLKILNYCLENEIIDVKNYSDKYGYTLLYHAIYCRQKDIFELLFKFWNNGTNIYDYIENGTNFQNIMDVSLFMKDFKNNFDLSLAKDIYVLEGTKHQISWLHVAVYLESLELIERLIHNGANINQQSKDGDTPLNVAVIRKNMKVIKFLLNFKDINVNIKEKEGFTSLHWACFQSCKATVECLLKVKDIDLNCTINDNKTPLHLAALIGDENIVKLLLSCKDEINVSCKDTDGDTPLMNAVFFGHSKIVEILLDFKETEINSTNNEKWSPLHLAVEKGNKNLVEHFLKMEKIEVNCKDSDDWTPLHLAVGHEYKEIVEILLKHDKIDINCEESEGKTPLALAVVVGNNNIAEHLLKKTDIEINCKTCKGLTPLHHAVIHDRKEIAEILLKHNKIKLNCEDVKGRTPLHFAVLEGKNYFVEHLLKMETVDINCKDSRGCRPLHLAVFYGYKEIVEMLLKHNKIDINLKNCKGCTPLHVVVHCEFKEIAEMLLQHDKIDINCEDSGGCTPLHLAVEKGNNNLVEYLLKMTKVEVNCKNTGGCTPLHLAVTYGYKEIVEMLLKHDKIDINCEDSECYTPLHLAVEKGNNNLVEYLLKMAKVNVNSKDSDGWTPLHLAVYYEYKEIVEILLKHEKIDINCVESKGNTPLHIAVEKRNNNIVEYLLKMTKIEVNYKNCKGFTPLHVAVFHEFKEIAEILLQYNKIDINLSSQCEVRTPLHIAVEKSNKMIVEYLLKMTKIEVNRKDSDGWTPLHLAVDFEYKEIVEMLLKHDKIDINCEDSKGYTPLHFAVDKGNNNLVEFLLKMTKVEVNIKDSNGWTPLHLAVDNEYKEIAEMLLKHDKIDINCEDSEGYTPLHLAVEKGNNNLVEYLLKMTKVEVNSKDSNGVTPLHLAVDNGYKEIVEMLLKHDKIDINCEDSEGRSPLHIAVEKGNMMIVRLLKIAAVGVNSKDMNL